MCILQGRPTFDASSCDDSLSAASEGSVLDSGGRREHGACWRHVICHCLKVEHCADLALHAYASSGRLTMNDDDENAVYATAPASHAPTFRSLSLRPDIRRSAFASMAVTPLALAALAISSLSPDLLRLPALHRIDYRELEVVRGLHRRAARPRCLTRSPRVAL